MQEDRYTRCRCSGWLVQFSPRYRSRCWLFTAKAWTARPDTHWSVPAVSGIFYGLGIDLTFMAFTNYLTDAYGVYSASALASSVFSRNIVAALFLPLAVFPLYDNLGVGWACSVLGFVCLALSPIPFVLIRYGNALRVKSPFCQQLKQQGEETIAGNRGDCSGLPWKRFSRTLLECFSC